jgi:hypothetical protein
MILWNTFIKTSFRGFSVTIHNFPKKQVIMQTTQKPMRDLHKKSECLATTDLCLCPLIPFDKIFSIQILSCPKKLLSRDSRKQLKDTRRGGGLLHRLAPVCVVCRSNGKP